MTANLLLRPSQWSFVDRIIVENPTRYDITIEVSDHQREGGMTVGTAGREATSTFEEVID